MRVSVAEAADMAATGIAATGPGATGAAAKRLFDIALALLLMVPALPLMAALWLAIRLCDGPPALYAAERIGRHGRPFTLWKFRTMVEAEGPEMGVSGGDKAHRVTPLGAVLRRWRLDELPQLFNVLAGSMSFVGPRPPVRQYVERFPQVYAPILRARPGITGLATAVLHAREDRILAATRSAEETDAVYVRRCIPRKARLDRIYLARAGLVLDVYILYLTAARLVPVPFGRARRLRSQSRERYAMPSRGAT
jgi:lipopolysaccharide/colanic/teichoic acid biosynthesis glycosyltransferase